MVGAKLAIGALLAVLKYRLFGKRTPFFVSWRITDRCTRKCAYCDINQPGDHVEPDLATSKRLLHEMAAAGTKWINFTGGEPLLWPGLPELLGDAVARGIKISLCTNGDRLPELAAVLPRGMEVSLSLNGPESVNDALRGKGSYAATVRALETARRENFERTLLCVVTRENYQHLDFVYETARAHQTRVQFQFVTPCALNSQREHGLSTSDEMKAEVVQYLRPKIQSGDPWIAHTKQVLDFLAEKNETTFNPCIGGWFGVRVTPAGELTNCWGEAIDGPERVSCLDRPFSEAFLALKPRVCHRCWCIGVVEANMLASLRPAYLWDFYRRRRRLA